jgi:hypothetical protein
MPRLRDFVLGISLANLCYLRVWADLLDPASLFYWKTYPSRASILAALAGVSLLGIALGTILTITSRCSSKAFRIVRGAVLIAAYAIVLGSFLHETVLLTTFLPKDSLWRIPIYAGVLAAVVTAVVAWPRRAITTAETLGLVLAVFLPVTFLQTLWILGGRAGAPIPDQPSAPAVLSDGSSARVLWMVFDELDQRIMFSQHPSSVSLPEVARFRSQAIYASNAYPPGPETVVSMPALISGRLLAHVRPAGAGDLLVLDSHTGEETSWRQLPNVFAAAKAAGFNTAVAGWYLPFCRVFGSSLTGCSWQMGVIDDREFTFAESLWTQAGLVVYTTPSVGPWIGPKIGTALRLRSSRRDFKDIYQRVWEDTRKWALDPSRHLILAHWPIPHPPGIYSRFKDAFSYEPANNYFDNLELVDRTVGELRREMETAGLWDLTTVLISSDHSWRTDIWRATPSWTKEETAFAGTADQRIPFLLKMRGQTEGVTYQRKFNTVVSHDLVLAILRGDLTTPQEVVRWLDQKADSPVLSFK